MIYCEHKDCDYKVGYTHRGSSDNKLIEGEFGDFYKILSGVCNGVFANRFHGDKNEMELFACPKCKRLFISEGDVYEDN